MIWSVKRPAMFSKVKLPARSVNAAPKSDRVGRKRNITAKMTKGKTARLSQGMRRGVGDDAIILTLCGLPHPLLASPIKGEVPLHSCEGCGKLARCMPKNAMRRLPLDGEDGGGARARIVRLTHPRL